MNNIFTNPQLMAMLGMGAGLMKASGPSPMPVGFGPALAQGMESGMQGALSAANLQRTGVLANLQALKLKKEMEADEERKNLSLQAAPPTSVMHGTGEQPAWMPPRPTGFQQIPLDRLAMAASKGVDISPFLKLNEALTGVEQVNLGGKIVLRNKNTGQVTTEMPVTAAPGAIPHEASDITPAGYRDFMLTKAKTGANNVINNVNAFTPASEAAQTEFMKSTRTNYEALRNAPTVLKNIEDAKKLIPNAKGFMGPGGEPLLEAVKFMNNRLGTAINTEGVKGAEELKSRLFMGIMDNLKKMDAQPSETQQRALQESLGKLGNDPNALPAVLDVFGDIIRGKVDIHNNEVQGATTRGVKFPYDPMIKLEPKGKKDGTFDLKQMPNPAQHRGRVIEDDNGKRFKSDGMTWRPL